MSMRTILTALAFALAGSLATAQTLDARSPSHQQAVDELIRIVEIDRLWADTLMIQVDQLVAQLKAARPDLEPDAESRIRAVAGDFFLGLQPELLEVVRQIFSNHFTEEELRQLSAYHNSELGRKTRVLMPSMIQELNGRIADVEVIKAESGRKPEYSEVAAELFRVMGYEEVFLQSGELFARQMIAEIKSANPDIEPAAEEEIYEEIRKELHNNLPWLMEFTDQFLNEHFTRNEQLAMLEYAKSAVGQKSNEIMPVVMQELGAWMGQLVTRDSFWELVAELSAIAGIE